jgi:putative membrane protein
MFHLISRTLICFGISLMFINLLVTKKIQLFINPRLAPLVALSAFILITLGLVQVWNKRVEVSSPLRLSTYFILLLPVLFFVLFPAKPLDAYMASKKGMIITSHSNKSQVAKAPASSNSPTNQATSSNTSSAFDDVFEKKADELKKLNVITFNEDNFMDRINLLNLYPEHLNGKKVRFYGFVYRDKDYPADYMMISRFTVVCCTADANIDGILVQTPKAHQLAENTWLSVDGVLESQKIQDEDVLVIRPTSLKRITPPKSPYVYANLSNGN